MKRINYRLFIVALVFGCLIYSCKKEDDILYGLNEVNSIPPNAEKGKLKSSGQYLNILYANLFQTALSASKQVDLSDLVSAFGDKDLIHEVIISGFMNQSGIQLPPDSLLTTDRDAFIEEAYKRFYVRPPSELEKEFFKNYLSTHENVTPELVYFAFAISNEYQFY